VLFRSNLGEAVHIHLDNIRIDLTVDEFIEFSDAIHNSLNELDILKGFSIDDFDIRFLNEIAGSLPYVNSIDIVKKKLSSLKCIVRDKNNFVRLLNIKDSPAYLYFKGDENIFKKYNQLNYFDQSNTSRLDELSQSIKVNGYPYNNKHIVTFGEQPLLIKDGQHRAAALANIYGLDHEIDVMVFQFSKRIKTYPRLFNVKVLLMKILYIVKREVINFLEWKSSRKDLL